MSGFGFAPFAGNDEFYKKNPVQCSILDPGKLYTPSSKTRSFDIKDGFFDQEPELGIPEDDLGLPDNEGEIAPPVTNETTVYQFAVSSRIDAGNPNVGLTPTGDVYTINLKRTIDKLKSIRLVHALIPNNNQHEFCVIQITNPAITNNNLSGNTAVLDEAFHILPASISNDDVFFNTVAIQQPFITTQEPSLGSELKFRIRDPTGTAMVFDFTLNEHWLLIFEIVYAN